MSCNVLLDSAVATLLSKYPSWDPTEITTNLNALTEMGYNIEQSTSALDAAKENNLETAMNFLLGGKRRSLKRKRSSKKLRRKTHKTHSSKKKTTRKRRKPRY